MDLQNHINDLLERLEEALEFTKWKRKDEFLWEYEGNSCYFVLQPDLLTYEESDKYVTKIWFKITDRSFSDQTKEELFSHLNPFKDQDYNGPYYWINPDYPKGYWYNHTL